ncbi:MAG: D-alanine--D-alanine ligase [Coriobacteriales bacterium]|jgi:D-alanine-D-alanine ligase|nr:D-alanine--D-alanine ligase [Coriobacteriales bacterium]
MTDSLVPKTPTDESAKGFAVRPGGPYRVALLCGGTSSEREVSLASAANVESVLASAGHTILRIDTAAPDFIAVLQNLQPDVAFIALHGKGGENGELQAVLELLGIPFTGSGVLGSALAMDKHRSKLVYQAVGVQTAPWLYLKAQEKGAPTASPERIINELGLPVVVKPTEDGSSVGISIVRDSSMLPQALDAAFAAGSDVLVEQYLNGVEITVPVLGSTLTQALPAIEIVPKNEFYDYESKYADQGSVHIIPARISSLALAEANRVALLVHEALGCYGVSRTDMMIGHEDEVWVIETNTIPGMTGTSLLPDAAQHIGISNQTLYELFIGWALDRAEQA